MASPSTIQFIEDALSCNNSPFALSYTDPDQKWIIRKHLISLLQDFPSLNPSIDTYTHNDGSNVNLLIASGDLYVSHSSIPIPITIWLHENYPHMAPMVYVSSTNSMYQIEHDHPFIELSGVITSPYLRTWLYRRSNLSCLVHNLVKIFSHYNSLSNFSASSFGHASTASKMEAMDRLSCVIHYDLLALRANFSNEMDELYVKRMELGNRDDITTSMIIGLDDERSNLRKRVKELTNDSDVLMNWLKVYHDKECVGIEDVFEAVDEESKLRIDCIAADDAIEDLIHALDKAVEERVVSFDVYIRQVRVLAREQFSLRARQLILKGTKILPWPH